MCLTAVIDLRVRFGAVLSTTSPDECRALAGRARRGWVGSRNVRWDSSGPGERRTIRAVTYWLKGAGSSADPLPDYWPRRSLLWRTANSPQRPSIELGDRLLYWAVGSGKVVNDG